MSTKTTRSGRSVKRPAKLISEDDGNNEEPMSNLTTKKPVKPLTKVNIHVRNLRSMRYLAPYFDIHWFQIFLDVSSLTFPFFQM